MTRATIRGADGTGSAPMPPQQSHMPSPPTPTQQMVGAAATVHYAVDSRNRRIGIVRLSAIDQYRLMKFMGEYSSNVGVVGMAMAACAVREIDGNMYAMPNSETEVQAMINRLDNEGFEAVSKVLAEKFGKSLTDD